MKESNLKLAQKDIDDALKTVEEIESFANQETLPKDLLKEKFFTLTQKVEELEDILKTEGIL